MYLGNICNEITDKISTETSNEIERDPVQISYLQNEYLLSFISQLIKNLRDLLFECSIKEHDRSTYLKSITTELCELAKTNKKNKNNGIDEIPTSVMKLSTPILKEILCILINNIVLK